MVGLFAYFVNLGSVLGAIIVNQTSKRLDYLSFRIPLASMFIVPTILAIGTFFIPESPRWLLYKKRDEEARKALEALRSTHGEPLELEWAEMVRGRIEELRIAETVSFKDMFRGNDLRRTLLCYAMVASQTASGIWFVIGYGTYFLTLAGITKAFDYAIMNMCLGFFGVHCGILLMKKLMGRRSILIIGSIAVAFCQLGMGIAWAVSPTANGGGKAIAAFAALNAFFYDAGPGPAMYPVATELVSSRLRPWTVGTATALGYLLAWLSGFCSPYFVNPQELNWVCLLKHKENQG